MGASSRRRTGSTFSAPHQQDVVPNIDGPQELAVKAEARYNEQTSLLMRELEEISGLSPKQLEHLLIGYTGTMGSYVMAAADGLIRAAKPRRVSCLAC